MRMLIGGRWCEAVEGEQIAVKNPATGDIVDHVPRGNREDAREAIESAEVALNGWESLSARERGKILFSAAQQVRSRVGGIAELLTREQGKPLPEARNEILGFANVLEYYHAISGTVSGDAMHLPSYGYGIVLRRPLGVCGAIIPWNMPAIIMGWKVGPALVAGNSLVLKPASSAPLTCLTLASIMHDAGVPPGVLNVVTGDGTKVGEEIASHPGIRKVSFTGNVETGRRVAELAAPTMKRLTLELGGSDPMIVCGDAPLKTAVDGAVRGRFYNCGQTCTAVKRLYLVEEIADAFIDALSQRIAGLNVDNGLIRGADIGPLHSEEQRERIANVVRDEDAGGEGRILVGGMTPDREALRHGWFYSPTLIAGPSPDSPLLTGEVFGPVLPVVVVQDLDEAVDLANRSQYALGASIWTREINALHTAAEHLNAGVVWVNQHLRVPPEVPFGGSGISGLGRENGYGALERYLETKTVLVSEEKKYD